MVEILSKHRLIEIVAASTLVLAASLCRADAVDDYVRMEMENQRIPGIALAVIRSGKAVKVQAYGVANIESGVAVTKDTVFALASVSKQILATAVMLLVDRGKMDLDDEIGRFLPDAPEGWRRITVRQLLSHTAGLSRMPPDFD